jgi:hypothetical protein
LDVLFLEAAFFFVPARFDLGGTLAPARRASLSPMATACFRLFTFFPLRPDLSLCRLNSPIVDSIFLDTVRFDFEPEPEDEVFFLAVFLVAMMIRDALCAFRYTSR